MVIWIHHTGERNMPVSAPKHQGFAGFETAIGRCIAAWSDRGLLAVQLPQATDALTRERLSKRCAAVVESEPPASVQQAIQDMKALLNGESVDLSGVELDMTGVADFDKRVYEIARGVPSGSTLTYGDIARCIGDVQLSRDVGQALATNPFAIVVPCHRILAAGNKPGGFSAQGGPALKLKMLEIERAYVNHTPSLFDFDDTPPWRTPLGS